MNKYIYLTISLLMTSTMALAECVGGTWITANSVANNPNENCTATTCNGATFCKSNGAMNWWSAFTWCASNGLTLAKFQDMCPGIPTSSNNVTGACPNLQGKGNDQYRWFWTEVAVDKNQTLVVHPPSGRVTTSGAAYSFGRNSASAYALCK